LDAVTVNGPEDVLEWGAIDWRTHERNVVRLRRRIFKATRERDWAQVRSLQKMMLRSWSNTLVSVRQVTQRNAGRRTAGIDGQIALSSEARAEVAVRVHRSRSSWNPMPVRRVRIPKAGNPAKLRPLGIPVIMDRCHQARVRNALEPEWEARFEPRSYGFRPGRSCADAIDTLFVTLRTLRANRVWLLDADLAAAFDNIDHERLLNALGPFPARGLIERWLKAGVVENEMFTPTEQGSPQGGVISPLLMNVALHGLEEAAGVRYRMSGVTAGRAREGTPVLVRYADDLVVCCYSEQEAYRVKQRLAEWLKPRGLVFNEDKTRVVHVEAGFDFLGCNVRRYPNGKLLIKPSRDAVKRLRKRLTDETRRMRGSSARELVSRLNPIIRGWAAYYRGVVAARIFNELDHHVWWLTWRWAVRQHPGKPKKWIKRRYFGKHNRFRDDHWVFGERVGNHTRYLVKFSWTPIVRHQLIQPGASPDDPDLIEYWAKRRQKVKPPLDDYNLALLAKQGGRCPLCGENLLTADQPPQSPDQWERWWLGVVRRAIAADYLTHERQGTPDRKRTRMVHTSCYRSLRARQRRRPATSSPAEPSGLA
jgi:RNA-directed DNA polymerase